jgi:hypothetical protein
MVYNTQNQCICGLCPSFAFQNKYKTQSFGNWICYLSSREVRETSTLLGPLERVTKV